MKNLELFQEKPLLADKIELTPTSLVIRGDMSEVDYELAWGKLALVHGGTQWWIGDLADQSDRADLAEKQGIERKSIREYAYVCRNIEPSIRMDALYFGHHQLVASMEPADQREWLDKAVRYDWTVAKLRSEIRLHKPAETPPIPEGKYNIIYADPPWRYDFSPTSGRKVERHYPTMDIDDICMTMKEIVDKIAHDNCTLFLWGTSPKLTWAFDVIKFIDFEYKTCMVWVKDKIGMGYYARQQHELLLIAGRGESQLPEPSARPSSIIEAPRLEHSAKPEEVYGIIERMYPNGKTVELFARGKREGWTSWGNDPSVT